MSSPRPASNRAWCIRWDELSTALLEELQNPDCDVNRVADLIRERRRLTTARPVNRPGEPEISEEDQVRWLERSLQREAMLADLAREVKDRVVRSMASLEAGQKVRHRFGSAEAKPRMFSTRI